MLERLQQAKAQIQQRRGDQHAIDDREQVLQLEHINARLSQGKYFSLTKEDKTLVHFQVVCKAPRRKAYVQRICLLGKDETQLYLFLFFLSL